MKVGDVVKNGLGTEYTIISIFEGKLDYPVLAVCNINKRNAHCQRFTIDGYISCNAKPNDVYNLIN